MSNPVLSRRRLALGWHATEEPDCYSCERSDFEMHANMKTGAAWVAGPRKQDSMVRQDIHRFPSHHAIEWCENAKAYCEAQPNKEAK